jgi:hypothetical protein
MAATFQDLKQFINAAGLNYEANDELQTIAIGFTGEPDDTTYRDEDGDPSVRILVRLVERGEFVAVFSPQAWDLSDSEHVPAVCEAVARFQARMKLIRFDLGEEGSLQPNVEIPLEKAPLCAEQLHRGIAAVLIAVKEFDPVVRHAMETGVVDLGLINDEMPDLPAEINQILELGERAGGLDALEQLLGGGDAPPVET